MSAARKPTVRFCSELARHEDHPEPLLGTAHTVKGFILITWPRKLWERQQFRSQGLPVELTEELKRIQRTHRYFTRLVCPDYEVPALRIYLMPENRLLEVTTIHEAVPLLRTAFPSDELKRVPLDSRWCLNPVPLLLCCTNGARDRCCAKFGFAVFKEAARQIKTKHLSLDVMQSTHLTGDRFAACALALPSGDMYGWLRENDVDELLASVSSGNLHSPRFRGNSYLPELEQIVHGSVHARFRTTGTPIETWTVEWEHHPLGITALVRMGDAPIGRLLIGTRDYMSGVDCDGVDANTSEVLSRRVVLREDWI